MNLSSGRRGPRIINWLHLCLSICLLVSLPEAGQAQQAPDRKRQFLEMYARAYYPGRNGQIMLVPREGDFVTLNEPASLFMHGSPWNYDANIPLLFFGPPFIRRGTYADAAVLFQPWPSSSDCPCPRRSRADRWKKPWIHRLVARAPFW